MKYIFVEIRFEAYNSKKDKDVQNGTRRALMGLRSPNVPVTINESLCFQAIQPISFSLIKQPLEELGDQRLAGFNLARGALAIFSYTWVDDKLNKTIGVLKTTLSSVKEKSKWLKWSAFRIYVAEEV